MKERPLHNGEALYPGEKIALRFTPTQRCFLYIFILYPDGGFFCLFPASFDNYGNELTANESFDWPLKPEDCAGAPGRETPEDGPPMGNYFNPDSGKGEIAFYVAAALEKYENLFPFMKSLAALTGGSEGRTLELTPHDLTSARQTGYRVSDRRRLDAVLRDNFIIFDHFVLNMSGN